jgi:hypothetical protein
MVVLTLRSSEASETNEASLKGIAKEGGEVGGGCHMGEKKLITVRAIKISPGTDCVPNIPTTSQQRRIQEITFIVSYAVVW